MLIRREFVERRTWISDEELSGRPEFQYEGEVSERAVARFCGISPTTVGVISGRIEAQTEGGVHNGHPYDHPTNHVKPAYTEPEARKRLCTWATAWLARAPAEGESHEYAEARRLVERAVKVLEKARQREKAAA